MEDQVKPRYPLQKQLDFYQKESKRVSDQQVEWDKLKPIWDLEQAKKTETWERAQLAKLKRKYEKKTK